MSRLDTILRILGAESAFKQATPPGAPGWFSSSMEFGSYDPVEEQTSYEELANRFSVSDLNFMCGTRLGDMAGGAELLLFPPDVALDPDTGKPDPGDAIPPGKHPFYDLLNHPNPHTTRFEWLKQVALVTLLSNKGSFVHIDDGQRDKSDVYHSIAERVINIDTKADPVALWTLLPSRIKVKEGDGELVDHFLMEQDMGKPKVKFSRSSIMWIREFNPMNFMDSLSRMTPSRIATDFDMAAKTSNIRLFKNGMRPGPIVEADRDFIDPNELAMMENYWEEMLTGVDNWFKILPLWGGFKLSASQGFTPSDADYVRGSEQAQTRVFGVWGVHPGIVFVDNVNKANAEVGEYVTRKYTLDPLMSKVASGISKYILPLFVDAPPAQAYFVNIVPKDEERNTNIQKAKAGVALTKAQAVKAWVDVLGPEEGLKEAKLLGVVSEDITGGGIKDPSALMQPSGMGAGPSSKPGGPSQQAPSTNGTAPKVEGAAQASAEAAAVPAAGDTKMAMSALLKTNALMAKLLVDGVPDQDAFIPADDEDFAFSVTPADLAELEKFWDKSFPEYAGLLDAKGSQ